MKKLKLMNPISWIVARMLHNNNVHLRKKIIDMEQNIKELDEICETFRSEQASLIEIIDDCDNKIIEMSNDYDILKDENETLKDKIIELKIKLEEAYEYQKILLAEKTKLEEECERLYEELVSV